MPINPVGYIIRDSGGETIVPGFGELYDYTWAGNGIFVQAENPLFLSARIPICSAKTRGLPDLAPNITMKCGKIPQRFFDFILDQMLLTPHEESYFAIVRENGAYYVRRPGQTANEEKVTYEKLDNVVAEFHSHGDMVPFFSSQDNDDEQGLKIYGVVGMLSGPLPCALLRVGVYGYFYLLDWSQVFQGFSGKVKFLSKENFHGTDHEIAENIKDYWKHLGNAD